MPSEMIYSSKKIESTNKRRAERLNKHIPGRVEFDKNENAWGLSTMIILEEDYPALLSILFFEEAVGFELLIRLPDYLNNDIFKRKFVGNETFEALGKFGSRYFLTEFKGDLILNVNIAYNYEETDITDCYNADTVVDIIHYIGNTMRDEFISYLDRVKPNI